MAIFNANFSFLSSFPSMSWQAYFHVSREKLVFTLVKKSLFPRQQRKACFHLKIGRHVSISTGKPVSIISQESLFAVLHRKAVSIFYRKLVHFLYRKNLFHLCKVSLFPYSYGKLVSTFSQEVLIPWEILFPFFIGKPISGGKLCFHFYIGKTVLIFPQESLFSSLIGKPLYTQACFCIRKPVSIQSHNPCKVLGINVHSSHCIVRSCTRMFRFNSLHISFPNACFISVISFSIKPLSLASQKEKKKNK